MKHLSRILRKPVQKIREQRDEIISRIPHSLSRLSKDAQNLWQSSESSDQIRDYSHWLGKGRWEDEKEWEEIGNSHYAMYQKIRFLAGMERPFSSMIEWGPGGGANAVKFCTEFSDFYGIDISKANLGECERVLKERSSATFHPIHIEANKPERVKGKIQKPVDFFLTTAVFQHFPSQAYGLRVLKTAYDLLTDDGLALVQTRYQTNTPKGTSKIKDYQQNVLTFTSYPIDEFWNNIIEVGFTPLGIVLIPESLYAYYFMKKKG